MIFSFWKTVKCNHHVIIECFPVYLASRDLLRTQIFLSSILASKALFSQVSRAGGGGFGGAVFRAALFTSGIVASILAADRKESVNALPKGMLTGWVGVAR
jgi:hypothetical protein